MRYIFKLVFFCLEPWKNSRGPGSLNGQRYCFNSLLEELLSAEQKGSKMGEFWELVFYTPEKSHGTNHQLSNETQLYWDDNKPL